MRRLQRAILLLPSPEREIIVACIVQGLSNEGAAIRFRLSANEVEQLLVRALMCLVRQMR